MLLKNKLSTFVIPPAPPTHTPPHTATTPQQYVSILSCSDLSMKLGAIMCVCHEVDSTDSVPIKRNMGGDNVKSDTPTEDGAAPPVIVYERVRLKRNVGLISGTSMIVGTIIGSGIFISPKGVLQETGSVGLSLIVWATAGILSLFGSLAYAEIGTLIPKSGGEYPYLLEALGPIVAYMYSWTKIIVLGPSMVAIICLTFAEYLVTFFEYCGSPAPPLKLVTAVVIVAICIINCYDTGLAARVQVVFTFAKLVALGLIVVVGIMRMAQGHVKELNTGFTGTTTSASAIALSFYDALWAYDGWNNLNYLTEELKKPNVNLPRANIFGVLLVTVLYVLVNMSYLTVLSASELLESDAVAVTWGERMFGAAGIIMPIFVMLSTFGAANGSLYAGGRTVYAAAREGHLPEVLSYVHCKRYTPLPSILFTTVLALLMIIPLDVGALIDFFSFAAWLFYALTIVCLFVLRWTMKDAHRPIKVPIVLPIIFLLCSIYLVVAPIIEDPRLEFLYAFLFMVGGLVLYFPLVVFKWHKGCFDPVTLFCQLFMEVVPSPYVPDE
ncbi:hypothetical protein ScPMuIL_001359 [Solemya velum]